MENKNLAADEARREQQLESMKMNVDSDINAAIKRRAVQTPAADDRKIAQVANDIRGSAIDGVVEKDRELGRARGLARVGQVVNYLFGILYALLAVRLVLSLAAARNGAGFARFINGVTEPFYGPFRNIVQSPRAEGGYTLALPILIAMGAYGLLHLGVRGLLRLIAHRETKI